jgi:hypothetical protein
MSTKFGRWFGALLLLFTLASDLNPAILICRCTADSNLLEHFKLIKEINVTDGNNTELKAGLYELDEISFGDTTLKKIQVYVLDLSNLKSKLPNVDIVLGLNVIQNFNWQFDTQSSQHLYNNKK